MLMVWEGDNIIKTTRKMLAATNPYEVDAGIFHSSISYEDANRDIALWFPPSEMVKFEKASREKYSVPDESDE